MKTNVENWMPVKGYEGLYEVSDKGNVRNSKGRLMKFFKTKNYNKVELTKNGVGTNYYVHRLVAAAFIPNSDPSKNIINHKDEDPQNNNVENLEWCDYSYNLTYKGAQERRLKSRYGKTA